VTLFIVILINVLIGWIQEMKADAALSALMGLEVPQGQIALSLIFLIILFTSPLVPVVMLIVLNAARVIRDGQINVIPAQELVPGDLVSLEEGDQVPADLRLVQVTDLSIIEAILTGTFLLIFFHIYV